MSAATKNARTSSHPLAGAAAGVTGRVVGRTLQLLFPTTSAKGRALRMAALTAGVTGSYVGYMVQRLFLGEERRERKRRATDAKVGRRIRDELQLLRGPAMKFGQALSLHTDIVPEDLLSELAKLQMEAPGMHPSLALAQFKSSLGRQPDEVFKRFDPEPFAAASLGQVHHATRRDGTPVAVKIQYPNIRTAVENDFKWVRTMSKPMLVSGHADTRVLDELERQILAETDYVREADNIEFFRARLKPLDFVAVPAVYRDESTDQVLTMSVVAGEHLETFLARKPSQRLRDEIGSRLFELFFFQKLVLEALHADPHRGNYLFSRDGTIGLVDFGCVKYLNHEFVENLHKLYLYPGRYDSAEYQRLLEAVNGKMRPAVRRAMTSFAERFYRKVFPPSPEDDTQPFDFSDATFMRDFLREMSRLFRVKYTLPEHLFITRAEIGLYTTLHRLKARVPTSAIARRMLTERRARAAAAPQQRKPLA